MVKKFIDFHTLPIDKIVWNIHYVYINEITNEIQCIYLPLENKAEDNDILNFIEGIIYSIVPLPYQNSDIISRFRYFMNDLTEFDANQIEKFIIKEDRSIVNTIKSNKILENENDSDGKTDEIKNNKKDDAGDETGLLTEPAEEKETDDTIVGSIPFLYRVLTQEKIYINKPRFRIGRDKSYVDYMISSNDAVSRGHADIIIRGMKCYIEDLNSTNKTFINKKPLASNQEVELFDGDKLKMANEEFVFRYGE